MFITLKKTIATTVIALSVLSVNAQSVNDAKKAFYNEQPQKAKEILKSLVKASPADLELNYRLGNAYYQLGKKDSAAFYFTQGMKSEEKFNYNLAGMGKLALDDKNIAQAKIYFDKLTNNGKSKDSKAYTFVGDAYFNSTAKDADNAIIALNKAIELDGKNVEARLIIAPAYLAKGDGGKAVTNYEYATEADPTLSYGFMKIGQIYMMSRNYDEALKNFKKSNAVDPTFAPVYKELGEYNYYAKNYAEAAANYKKYIELAGATTDNQSRYASFLFLNKDYPGATAIIESIMKTDSSNVVLSRLIGYSYYEQGKYPEGLSFMQKFFAKADTSKIIGSDYSYYAKLLSKVPGNDSLAVQYLNKAIALDSTNGDLYGDLATTLTAQKKYLEAAAVYKRKVVADRPSSNDFFFMGRSYYYGNDFKDADTAFAKVNELQPTAAIGWLWRARSNSQLDPESDKGLAQPYYSKFIELATDEAKYKKELVEAHSYMGYYHFLQKDNAGAKTSFLKVKELDPDNEKAVTFLKSLDAPKTATPPKK